VFRFKNGSLNPVLLNTLNYQLDDHVVGQLQFKTDSGLVNTAMSTAIIYEKDDLNLNCKLQLSPKNSYASLSIARSFLSNDIKLKSSVQYGLMGATLTYGVEKQVTKFSRVDASIMVNSLAGVVLSLE
jgi:hypothetical protein